MKNYKKKSIKKTLINERNIGRTLRIENTSKEKKGEKIRLVLLRNPWGKKEWEGTNKEIIFSKNERLNNFIFASEFLQDAKDMRMLEIKGKIDNSRNMDDLLK